MSGGRNWWGTRAMVEGRGWLAISGGEGVRIWASTEPTPVPFQHFP